MPGAMVSPTAWYSICTCRKQPDSKFRPNWLKRGRSTPVIVITGDDKPEAQSRALRLGAKGYFGKPVDDNALLAAIGVAIAGGRVP